MSPRLYGCLSQRSSIINLPLLTYILTERGLRICSTEVLLNLCKSLIHPMPEYCCLVWDPSSKTLINLLESAQKLAAKMCLGDWKSSYTHLLEMLSLPTLQSRQSYIKLCMVYKIFNEESYFPPGFFTYQPSIQTALTKAGYKAKDYAGHSYGSVLKQPQQCPSREFKSPSLKLSATERTVLTPATSGPQQLCFKMQQRSCAKTTSISSQQEIAGACRY